MAFGVYPKLTKDYILERINQEQMLHIDLVLTVKINMALVSLWKLLLKIFVFIDMKMRMK